MPAEVYQHRPRRLSQVEAGLGQVTLALLCGIGGGGALCAMDGVAVEVRPQVLQFPDEPFAPCHALNLRLNALALLPATLLRVVGFPLVHQPRLDESAQEPLPRCGRLRLQGCQKVREVIHGEIDSFRKVHKRQGVPRLGRLRSGLGNLRMEFGQQIGGYLIPFDGFRDTPKEPDSKGSIGSGAMGSRGESTLVPHRLSAPSGTGAPRSAA